MRVFVCFGALTILTLETPTLGRGVGGECVIIGNAEAREGGKDREREREGNEKKHTHIQNYI